MVGQQLAVVIQALYRVKECFQFGCIIYIRRHIAHLAVDLCQGRAAETIPAIAQINQQQHGIGISLQLRGQGFSGIRRRCKGSHDQRQRRGDGFLVVAFLPRSLHRHRILAHRNTDTQFRAQFHADRLHGIEQCGIFTVMPGRSHPVGGQFNVANFCDASRCNIGDGLAYCHAPGSGCIQYRQRRALTQSKGFAQRGVEAHQGHGHVGDRHLPRADHLVARSHAAHAAVADIDEEALVRNSGQTQHAGDRVFQFNFAAIERGQFDLFALYRARHFGRLAQQDRKRHIHGIVFEFLVMHHQPVIGNGMTQHGKRAAFAHAYRLKLGQSFRRNRQHIALLRFVAPDLHRRHAALFRRHFAQFKMRTASAAMHQLGQGIGDAARAHIMNRQDEVVGAHLPATVDDFLRAALHLRVAALHRIKVQIFRIGAGIHAGSRAAAQTDQHAGAAQLDQQGTHWQRMLVGVLRRDIAHAAGQHNGLVVAAHFAIYIFFISAEITGQIGAAKFIVKGRAADRPVQHDLQGGSNARRFAVFLLLPRLHKAGNRQIGDRKTGQTRLGFGTRTGCALIADFATCPRRCTGKRCNRGGVIVRFHFHQRMREFFAIGIAAVHIGIKAVNACAFDHRGIVRVGDDGALRVQLVRIAYHAEQGHRFLLVIDHPVRVKNFVAAMLGVCLCKHHQLDIGGVTLQLDEILHQIVDFIIRQRQTQFVIRHRQSDIAAFQHIYCGQGLRLAMGENLFFDTVKISHHGFGHAVMQQGLDGFKLRMAQCMAAFGFKVIHHTALYALYRWQRAMLRDIACLGRPWRNGAQTRHHQQTMQLARKFFSCTIQPQQALKQLPVGIGQRRFKLGKVPVPCCFNGQIGCHDFHCGAQFIKTESG